ncbi:MAG TPA: DUF6064 family protein [Chitinophagaceae bacterium]
MQLPFTTEEFLEVFRRYNNTVFPLQVVFYIIAASVVFAFLKPGRRTDQLINAILAFFWLWMGVVYHFIFFAPVNPAAWVFGSLFILQGLLFLYFGVLHSRLSYRATHSTTGILGSALVALALFVYPLAGYLTGHVYPAAPGFGLPCPTTIFTFGLLLWTKPVAPLRVVVIPLAWSVIGFTAAWQLGMTEDFALLPAALLAVITLLLQKRRDNWEQQVTGTAR